MYGHIIDPQQASGGNGIAWYQSTPVKGNWCDALSLRFFVMDWKNAQDYWRTARNLKIILIMEDGEYNI